MNSHALFGEKLSELRRRTGLTLRRFCMMHGLDPGNFSKMERGRLSPPASREKLEQLASFLQLDKGSDEWHGFFDLASACRGEIPSDMMSDAELVKKLPLVFRTLRGQRVEPEQLDLLADIIKKT